MTEPERTHGMDEMVTLPKRLLEELFDLAVNSTGFGSGYWDNDDVVTSRAVAEILGVDPAEATPRDFRKYFAHDFAPYLDSHGRPRPGFFGGEPRCQHCNAAEDHVVHHGVSLGVHRSEDVVESEVVTDASSREPNRLVITSWGQVVGRRPDEAR